MITDEPNTAPELRIEHFPKSMSPSGNKVIFDFTSETRNRKGMAHGHLLAAPDRIVTNLESILEVHEIACEVESIKESAHARCVTDVTSLRCRNGKTQIGMGIIKRRGRNGVDIVLAPECRSFFRRNLDSEKLAKKIAEILCKSGASEHPNARCENLE